MDDSYFESDEEFNPSLGDVINFNESDYAFQYYSNPNSNVMKNSIPKEGLEKIIGLPLENKDSTTNSNKVTFITSRTNEPEKKRRGRQVSPNTFINLKRGRHVCSDEDNVLTKIQVHFSNFLISFLNDCIFTYKKDENNNAKFDNFSKLDYRIKSKISSKHFNKMKNSTIYDILKETPISSKYKTQQKCFNEIILKKLDKIPWFNQLFQMNFLDLFHRYYINVKKEVKKVFVIDREITLTSKTKTYYFLLEKNPKIKKEIIKAIENNYKVNYTDILKFNEKTDEYFEYDAEY